MEAARRESLSTTNPKVTSRSSTAAPIMAVLAILLATLGTYVVGYLWLGARFAVVEKSTIPAGSRSIVRVYPRWWLAQAFAPAAQIETWLTNIPVAVESEDTEREALP